MAVEGQIYKVIRVVLLAAFTLLHSNFAPGQAERSITKDHFTRADGLPHRHIIDLIEGPSGRLWISTFQGIGYFDGVNFTTVPLKLDDGEPSTPFRCRFVKGADGNIWALPTLGSLVDPILVEYANGHYPEFFQFGGAYQLPVVEKVERYNYQGFAKSEQGKKTKSLLGGHLGYEEDQLEEMWLWQIIHKLANIEDSEGHQLIDIVSAMEDNSYVIWVPGRYFLWIHNDFQSFEIIPWTDRNLIPSNWNLDYPIDERGHFFYPAAVKNGELKMGSFEMPVYFLENSRRFSIDIHYDFWFFTDSGRLFHFDEEKTKPSEFLVPKDRIYTIYPIKNESIWLGTINGLHRLRFRSAYFNNLQSIPFGLDEKAPMGFSSRGIAENSVGEFFVFENYGPLYKKDPIADTLVLVLAKTPVNEEPLEILDLKYIDRENAPADLLLCAPTGLLLWNSIEESFHPISNDFTGKPIRRLIDYGEKDRVIAVGFFQEYYLFDPLRAESSDLRKFSIPDFRPLESKNGYLYGNSRARLIKYDIETDQWEAIFYLSQTHDAAMDDIRAILFADSILWLGTFEGLYGLDISTYELRYHYHDNNGLAGNIVYSMLHDEKGLWLGTDQGLTYLEPGSGFIRSFFEEDGLSHNEFNSQSSFIDSRGYVWMGGMNGINIFDPHELRAKSLDPGRLFLTGITVFDTDLKRSGHYHFAMDHPSAPLILEPGHNSINIEVAYIDPSSYGRPQYSWHLEGFEAPWTNRSAEPMLSYRKIPPGNYTLKVRAFDVRGVPAANELSLPLTLQQYWYLQTWAWAIWIALGLFGLVFAIRFALTRRLQRQRVIQLEELDRQKTNLYTNITHEFRTPLTVILGLSEDNWKRSDGLDVEKQQQHFKVISHHGRKLLHLVNQMMELASLESGNLKMNETDTDLPAFLSHLVNSFMSVAETRGIVLKFVISKQRESFYRFDTEKVQQVLSNLLSNALKFSPENSEVEVRAIINESGNKSSLLVEVIDSGPGIPPEETRKIFDRFHRVETGLKANTPGSGIGLALARELVELLRGEIGVRPNETGGSVFFFDIPVKRIQGQPRREEIVLNKDQLQNSLQSAMMDSGNWPKESDLKEESGAEEDSPLILLVEDNEDVMNYLQSCIPSKYRTIRAMNGKEGLKMAIENVPDIIISDVMMPEMDGYEFCFEAKSNRATSHIPIILLTAKSDEKSRITGLQQGADAYLSKPFNRDELLIRIDNMFQLIERVRHFHREARIEVSQAEKENLSPDREFLNSFYRALENHLDNAQLTLDDLASELHLSRSQLFRKVKALTGSPPSVLLKDFRLNKAKQLRSEHPNATIAEISYRVGFSDPKYFSKVYNEKFVDKLDDSTSLPG